MILPIIAEIDGKHVGEARYHPDARYGPEWVVMVRGKFISSHSGSDDWARDRAIASLTEAVNKENPPCKS